MKARDAITILMQSPLYFRLDPQARRILVLEFISRYDLTPRKLRKAA